MGGTVASALAERYPRLLGGVVIVDSSPENRFRDLPFTGKLATKPIVGHATWQLSPDASIRDSLESAFAGGYDVPDEYVEDVRQLTFTSYSESYGRSADFVDAKSLDDRLAPTRLPLMVIFGTEDALADPKSTEVWAEGVPGVRIERIEGSGHTPFVERPRTTARLIDDFARDANAQRRRQDRR